MLISINLVLGAITFKNYGESTDEPRYYQYADQSLNAYQKWIDPSYVPNFGPDNLRDYGPAFAMGVDLLVRLSGASSSPVSTINFWHFSYFIIFLIAVVCFYFLSRRWMSDWAAFGITCLFATQPLLVGHAFINPKDTPFMAFFLMSLVAGLWMCDRNIIPKHEVLDHPTRKALIEQMRQNYQRIPQPAKKRAAIITSILLILAAFLIVGIDWLNNLIASIVQKFYQANPRSSFGRIFKYFAHHAGILPVEKYIHKAQILFLDARSIYFVLALIGIIGLYRACLPWSFQWPSKTELLNDVKKFLRSFTIPSVILAGLLLGLTTSVRVLGPLAGFMVCVYAFWMIGKKALPTLTAYAVIAMAVMYLTWPALWSDPIHNLIASLSTMSNFQFNGVVLFNGMYYYAYALPRSYLPTLISIQLTEPVIVLFAAGILFVVWDIFKHEKYGLGALAFIWFFFPVGYMIVYQRQMYDNFRQFLFTLPPIFLLGGFALDAIFRYIKSRWARIILIIVMIFPGVYWNIKLYPYEYTYYNSFVGGVQGAFRKYENDYWITSYKEITEYLDEIAPAKSIVTTPENSQLATPYLRQDLVLKTGANVGCGDYYVILSSLYGDDQKYPKVAPIFNVQRDGATLGVLKFVPPCSP
jgi:hypothetical protein